MTNQQPIKPVFRASSNDQSRFCWYSNGLKIEISLDGENFHSMEFVREAIDRQKAYLKKCIVDPLTWKQGYYVRYDCPHCGSPDLYEKDKKDHCPICHESLDWSKVNDQ